MIIDNNRLVIAPSLLEALANILRIHNILLALNTGKYHEKIIKE